MNLLEFRRIVNEKGMDYSLERFTSTFSNKIIFTTSFGIEDQVILHKIVSKGLNIKVATVDTGRLFPETYELFWQTLNRFNVNIFTYFPDYRRVERMINTKGPHSFFNSVDDRRECCNIRKVKPLNRALDGMRVWISGIRSEQSKERGDMQQVEYDEARHIFKYYPLFDWRYDDVMGYIKDNSIPYSALHDNGYPSVGCQPCTRKVEAGEDLRAGRWWWEEGVSKECGCHDE